MLPAYITVPSHSQEAPKQDLGCWSSWSSSSYAMFGMLLCVWVPLPAQGSIVPVQPPASAHSQRENEMSGTGPQPGCAPAAHHSLVSPSGPSTATKQQPLLQLGASPASWSHVRLGWFPFSCVPDVCHRRSMGRCLQRCLMPPSWSPMLDRDAATADSKLLYGDKSPAATLGTLLQNSPVLWPETVGSRDTLCS